MSEMPKEVLDGGYPEDNEWDALNEQDELNAEYGADLAKLEQTKQSLGNTAVGAPEMGVEDLGQATAEEADDAGEKAA